MLFVTNLFIKIFRFFSFFPTFFFTVVNVQLSFLLLGHSKEFTKLLALGTQNKHWHVLGDRGTWANGRKEKGFF